MSNEVRPGSIRMLVTPSSESPSIPEYNTFYLLIPVVAFTDG